MCFFFGWGPYLAIFMGYPLSLNAIFTKHAAVIISHIAADFLLLENILIISRKCPGGNIAN